MNKNKYTAITILLLMILAVNIGYFLFNSDILFKGDETLNEEKENEKEKEENEEAEQTENNENDLTQKEEDAQILENINVKDFLNFKPNTLYTLANEDDETLQFYFTSIENNKAAAIRMTDNKAYLQQYIITDNKFTLDSVYELENMFSNVIFTPVPIDSYAPFDVLTAPITKDRKWESGGFEFSIKDVDMNEIVIAGICFDGVRNEITFSNKNTIEKYLRYEEDGVKTYNLINVETDYKFHFKVNAYYIDEQYETVPVEVNSSIHTNYSEEEMFTDILVTPTVEGYMAPLPEGTKINSIYKSSELDYIAVDFSEEFNKFNQYGSAIESTHIYAVVNTLCDFYKVDKLKLTVNGESYVSGHLYFEDDIIERYKH